MNNESDKSDPVHCRPYRPAGEKIITLSLDVTEKEYAQLKDYMIFFALSFDEAGKLDAEKFVSEDYPDVG